MSILTGHAIHEALRAGDLEIDPFAPANLNPNSYNLTLGTKLTVYLADRVRLEELSPHRPIPPAELDCRRQPVSDSFDIPGEGFVIFPGKLYLASTVERTASDKFIPMLEGRSSLARLGISVHQTGGFGDIGFRGQWTLEITCVEPVRIYSGIKVCQIQFWVPFGEVDRLYRGKYLDQHEPQPSLLAREIPGD